MIVVTYQEKITTAASVEYVTLGTETHDNIEEVLLPRRISGTLSPIFITKKFAGRADYRWEVAEEVAVVQDATSTTFTVTLSARQQVDKSFYLNNILKTPGKVAARLLYRYALVEVEYGHAQMIGKESGLLRTNKRYADSVQTGSMPKRRLAIVNQVLSRPTQTLVQVIPISSKAPHPSDKTSVEVTSCLTNLSHYNRRSWAVCGMLETVSSNRILAPMVTFSYTKQSRDIGFGRNINPAIRHELRDALMYGVASGQRVTESTKLVAAEQSVAALTRELEPLRDEVAELKKKLGLYEQVAAQYADDTGSTVEEVLLLAEASVATTLAS